AGDQRVASGQPFSYRVPAFDPDGDALIYSMSTSSPAPWLTIDTSSPGGVTIKGTPPVGAADILVTLTAADGRGSNSAVTFRLTTSNTAPVWRDLPDVNVPINTPNFSLTIPEAVDPDGVGSITYSIQS